MSLRLQRRNRAIIVITIGCVLALAGVIGVWKLTTSRTQEPATQHVQTTKPQVASSPQAVQSRLLVTGNSFWGRATNDAAKKTDNRYAFPFSRLHEFDRDKYDAWVTGLECPTTKKGASMTSADMEATLTFNCDPAYLPEFAKWFNIVTLANNHTDNMGVDGFSETQSALEAQGIQYFGHYDSSKLDDICEIVSLPATIRYDNGSSTKSALPIALCGYHFVFGLPSAESIAQISKYAKYFPTIVMPHGGAEYKPAPDSIKIDLYHSMIDAGADMVLGDHPHWIQTTEAYKGHLIVYSMGNFMFDQQKADELRRSAAIDIQLQADSSSNALMEWVKLGDTCKKYHDVCFDTAKGQSMQKVKLQYSFKVVGTDDLGYSTHRATDAQAQAIRERLRWNQTMKELGQ